MLLVLVVLILVPLLAFDLKMSQQLAKVQSVCSTKPAPVVMEATPTATPSATPTVYKHVVAPATSSGEVK
ncbi:MAG: hypothetical protein KGJ07_01545 [Patescibacteria group bacterium]|nr:hypothetical protein [Patescibacteria group bacterium]